MLLVSVHRALSALGRIATSLWAMALLASCGISISQKQSGPKPADSISNAKYVDTRPDPLASYLWHFKNTGQSNFVSQPGKSGEDINLGSLHDNFRGDGTTVIVSDGRIDLDHPDLADHTVLDLSKNYTVSMVPGVSPTTTDDTDEHGTAVMSFVGASRGNGRGLFGGAPLTRLIGYSFLDSTQSNSILVDQASGPAGSSFNYSYGYSTCMVAPVSRSYIDSLMVNTFNKSIYVTAAGNDFAAFASACGSPSNAYLGNGNLDQVKSHPYMIVVAALDGQGQATAYSTPGANVWISAPGGDGNLPLMGADLVGCDKGLATLSSSGDFERNITNQNENCSYVSTLAGTSFASPIVTGIVALIREACPSCGWRDVKHILAKTARKVDPTAGNTTHPASQNLTGYVYQLGWITNAAGFHFHPWYGFGGIDATAAVAMAHEYKSLLPAAKTARGADRLMVLTSNALNLAIPDNSATGAESDFNNTLFDLVLEHVQLRVTITHNYVTDLGIELTSPSGTLSKLLLINSGMVDQNLTNVTFGSNAFYGEKAKGMWHVKVVDGTSGDTGTLVNFAIDFLGHADPAATGFAPAPPTALTNTGNSLTWTHSTATNRMRYEACITQASATCREYEWFTTGATNSYAATKYSSGSTWTNFVSGASYKLRLRTIDTTEHESSVAEYTWTAP